MRLPKEVLKEVFGFDSFRGLQEEIIKHVLDGGDDVRDPADRPLRRCVRGVARARIPTRFERARPLDADRRTARTLRRVRLDQGDVREF